MWDHKYSRYLEDANLWYIQAQSKRFESCYYLYNQEQSYCQPRKIP